MDLLKIRDLCVDFSTRQGQVTALDGASLTLNRGETLGIVGESGCGKSITALALMGLIPNPPGQISRGEILFQGTDLIQATPQQLRMLRGGEIAMIFQEPMTSLNPVFTIGNQINEAILLHQNVSQSEAEARTLSLLKRVGISEPEHRAHAYPHELSGGMRQRVMIAMAISCRPKILIADEPTTALDVTVQAQIFDLMRTIQEEFGVAILLISHDMGVIAEMADRVAVMYAGRIVEHGHTDAILDHPQHPYTQGLINCIPGLQAGKGGLHDERPPPLAEIPGIVPPLHLLGTGCAFAERCVLVQERCRKGKPALRETPTDPIIKTPTTSILHQVACFIAHDMDMYDMGRRGA